MKSLNLTGIANLSHIKFHLYNVGDTEFSIELPVQVTFIFSGETFSICKQSNTAVNWYCN